MTTFEFIIIGLLLVLVWMAIHRVADMIERGNTLLGAIGSIVFHAVENGDVDIECHHHNHHHDEDAR